MLPLKLAEITECLPGAELKTEAEPNLLLTMIAKESSGNRVVVLKFASRDERNVMLSKIRYNEMCHDDKEWPNATFSVERSWQHHQ